MIHMELFYLPRGDKINERYCHQIIFRNITEETVQNIYAS